MIDIDALIDGLDNQVMILQAKLGIAASAAVAAGGEQAKVDGGQMGQP